MDEFAWLGVPSPDEKAWETYLQSLRDNLVVSWQRARSARITLEKVRASLGLPFMGQGTGEGGTTSPLLGAWSADLEQQAIEIQAQVALLTKFADETLQDKRKLIYLAQEGAFGIELLPTDDLRVDVLPPNSRPVVINVKSGQPENLTGTITEDGTVGILPLLIVAGTIVTVATVVSTYFVVERACKTLETLSEDKTMRTLATKNAELVMSGKATPEQAKALTEGIYKGAAGLREARAKQDEAEKSPWHATLQTLAFVGLGIAGLYVAAQFLSMKRGGQMATNPMLLNPKRFIGDAVVDIRYDGYSGGKDKYSGSVRAGGASWKFDELYAPQAGFPYAYDSPQAYDRMAASAVSFGAYEDESSDTAREISDATGGYQDDQGRYEVRRSKSGPGRFTG